MEARFVGALVGCAVGDAVGTSREFSKPNAGPVIKDMVGGGAFGLQPGEWTDDTSMALCLAESLLAQRAHQPIDQLERYSRWANSGHLSSNGECFDIGGTINRGIRRYEKSRESGGSGFDYCGDVVGPQPGNGSLMRMVPSALFFAQTPLNAIVCAGDQSRTTHASPPAIDACKYFAGLIIGALQGCSKDQLLAPVFVPNNMPEDFEWALNEEQDGSKSRRPNDLCPVIFAIASGEWRKKELNEVVNSGNAQGALEAAIWHFARTDNFQDGCLAITNRGGDSDTVAAIYGMLAGAFYGTGKNGIPRRWFERCVLKDLIILWARELYTASNAIQGQLNLNVREVQSAVGVAVPGNPLEAVHSTYRASLGFQLSCWLVALLESGSDQDFDQQLRSFLDESSSVSEEDARLCLELTDALKKEVKRRAVNTRR